MNGRTGIAATAASAAAAAVAIGLGISAMPSNLFVATVVCLGVCVLAMGIERRLSGDWLNGTTFLFGPVILGFVVRAASLLASPSATLEYPPWVSVATRNDLATKAMWLVTWASLLTYVGYRVGLVLGRRGAPDRIRAVSPARVRTAVAALAVIGVIGFIVLVIGLGGVSYYTKNIFTAHQQTAGLGIPVLMFTCGRLALFLWIALTPRPAGRRVFIFTLLVLMMSTGQRTDLVETMIPVVVIFQLRNRSLRYRHIAMITATTVVIALGLIVYRNAVYNANQPAIPPAARASYAARPGPPNSVFTTALISLDGLVLSQQAVPQDRAPAWGSDTYKVFEEFVPRQLWPNKPQYFTVWIASHYLGHAIGGVFSSGYGTFWENGLELGVIIGSLLFGAGVGWSYARLRSIRSPQWVVIYAIIALFAARFQIVGDANTVFFFLEAIVPVAILLRLVSVDSAPGARADAVTGGGRSAHAARDLRSRPPVYAK
jgi:hypothetical protein